jgi:hypothetical protein
LPPALSAAYRAAMLLAMILFTGVGETSRELRRQAVLHVACQEVASRKSH